MKTFLRNAGFTVLTALGLGAQAQTIRLLNPDAKPVAPYNHSIPFLRDSLHYITASQTMQYLHNTNLAHKIKTTRAPKPLATKQENLAAQYAEYQSDSTAIATLAKSNDLPNHFHEMVLPLEQVQKFQNAKTVYETQSGKTMEKLGRGTFDQQDTKLPKAMDDFKDQTSFDANPAAATMGAARRVYLQNLTFIREKELQHSNGEETQLSLAVKTLLPLKPVN